MIPRGMRDRLKKNTSEVLRADDSQKFIKSAHQQSQTSYPHCQVWLKFQMFFRKMFTKVIIWKHKIWLYIWETVIQTDRWTQQFQCETIICHHYPLAVAGVKTVAWYNVFLIWVLMMAHQLQQIWDLVLKLKDWKTKKTCSMTWICGPWHTKPVDGWLTYSSPLLDFCFFFFLFFFFLKTGNGKSWLLKNSCWHRSHKSGFLMTDLAYEVGHFCIK